MGRVVKLRFFGADESADLVTDSYDRIGGGYDEVWTNHMRGLTQELIELLEPWEGAKALDLTCGTGYATGLLAERTSAKVVGVDRSEGMLAAARENYGDECEFVRADALEYLRGCEDASFDIVTNCWALGYLRPWAVVKEISRVLRPGGKVAIIDNTMYTLFGAVYCTMLTFMEQPDKLVRWVRPRFLPRSHYLAVMMRLAGLRVLRHYGGNKSYETESGAAAVAKLRATGAAAGFENMAGGEDQEELFERLAEIMERKLKRDGKVRITHRYLAATGHKKK